MNLLAKTSGFAARSAPRFTRIVAPLTLAAASLAAPMVAEAQTEPAWAGLQAQFTTTYEISGNNGSTISQFNNRAVAQVFSYNTGISQTMDTSGDPIFVYADAVGPDVISGTGTAVAAHFYTSGNGSSSLSFSQSLSLMNQNTVGPFSGHDVHVNGYINSGVNIILMPEDILVLKGIYAALPSIGCILQEPLPGSGQPCNDESIANTNIAAFVDFSANGTFQSRLGLNYTTSLQSDTHTGAFEIRIENNGAYAEVYSFTQWLTGSAQIINSDLLGADGPPSFTVPPAPAVPEPGTLGMMMGGLLAVVVAATRRRRRFQPETQALCAN